MLRKRRSTSLPPEIKSEIDDHVEALRSFLYSAGEGRRSRVIRNIRKEMLKDNFFELPPEPRICKLPADPPSPEPVSDNKHSTSVALQPPSSADSECETRIFHKRSSWWRSIAGGSTQLKIELEESDSMSAKSSDEELLQQSSNPSTEKKSTPSSTCSSHVLKTEESDSNKSNSNDKNSIQHYTDTCNAIQDSTYLFTSSSSLQDVVSRSSLGMPQFSDVVDSKGDNIKKVDTSRAELISEKAELEEKLFIVKRVLHEIQEKNKMTESEAKNKEKNQNTKNVPSNCTEKFTHLAASSSSIQGPIPIRSSVMPSSVSIQLDLAEDALLQKKTELESQLTELKRKLFRMQKDQKVDESESKDKSNEDK